MIIWLSTYKWISQHEVSSFHLLTYKCTLFIRVAFFFLNVFTFINQLINIYTQTRIQICMKPFMCNKQVYVHLCTFDVPQFISIIFFFVFSFFCLWWQFSVVCTVGFSFFKTARNYFKWVSSHLFMQINSLQSSTSSP